jgi:hypothetical protein
MTEYSPLAPGVRPSRPRSAVSQAAVPRPRLLASHYIVLGSLTAIITVRFFSEALHALPRAVNFIDVPLLMVAIVAAVSHRNRAPRPVHESTFFLLSALFLAFAVASSLVNLGRVDVFPVLAFVYGFLGPPAFYLATYVLWEPGRARSLSRLLIGLAVIQFITIVAIDIPKFVRTHNPDVISGTFGTNAYQLVFFLLLFVALVVGIVTFEPQNRMRLLALPFIAAAFLAIFLAQYRALLATMALTIVFVGILVGRRQRGIMIAAAATTGFILAFIFIVTYVPTNLFTQAVDAVRSDPAYFVDSRLGPADDVYRLYGDNWEYPLIGTGPGTYSSRAWQTFAEINSKSGSDVAGPYARRLTGGRPYHTDVSDKYIAPRVSGGAKYGTYTFANPFSSYLALLAEVGIVAFAILVGIYGIALVRLVRAALFLARWAKPGDVIPALVLATATSFFVLLQIAVFGNWFETARVTVPSWILFAIVTRELIARREFASFRH